MKRIKIFDTTLRDGEQSPGCSMNLNEKIEMARQLEKLGVDVIEAGFAIASPMDFKSVQTIASVVENATVASLARCTKGDIDAAWDAVKEARHPRIHVFLATSDIHMEYKLRMTREQVLATITEMVGYAHSKCADIEFSAEDASRSDHAFLAQCYSNAIAAGATTLNVPDTVGYSTPQEMAELIGFLRENVVGAENVDFSVHCHDDLGMAVGELPRLRQGGRDAGGVHRQRHRRARGQRQPRGDRHGAQDAQRLLSGRDAASTPSRSTRPASCSEQYHGRADPAQQGDRRRERLRA